MSKWVMFDLETLGVGPHSVVVSIGAARFNEVDEPRDKMALLLDLEEQDSLGRKIDLGTVTWWLKQDQKARDWNFDTNNRYPVDVALRAFTTFCQGAELFWCRGTTFDVVLLEDLFKQYGMNVPWKFNQVRDVRSLDELDDGGDSLVGVVAHKPLDDCLMQIAQVQRVFGQPPKPDRLVPRLFEESVQPGD